MEYENIIYGKLLMSANGDMANAYSHERLITLKQDCYIGEVINGCFVPKSESTDGNYGENKYHKGEIVVGIPIRYIKACLTPFDMTEYGFVHIDTDSKRRKIWIKQ